MLPARPGRNHHGKIVKWKWAGADHRVSASPPAIGGIAKGGKGAAIGALTGGAAGLIYDLATRNR